MSEITIKTPRLILRPPVMDDLDVIHAAKLAVWPELQKWMSWASNEEASYEATKKYIEARQEETNNLRLIGLCRESGNFVIATGLDRLGSDLYSTGYWVAKNYLGQGYATEACNAVIRYCFKTYNPLALQIDHFEGNEKSRNVILKLGFSLLERMPDAAWRHADNSSLPLYKYIRTDAYDLPELEVTWS